ncbi:MAG TPA: alpha/beta fold hydrolase [Rhodocyclaceae bacterium]|nr:alpha/beta fold hydrolase [Rhodocyclaceae bacterium]
MTSILIHGWGQHSGVWRDLALPEVVCLDLPQTFALERIVDDFSRNAPQSCAVIGWSLGAQIALRWAQKYPQQVQKFVLISATPCFGQRSDWPHGSPEAVQQAFAAQVAVSPERALQRFTDLMIDGEVDMRTARKILRASRAERPLPPTEALLDGLRFLAETDLRASLTAEPPSQPALIIHGAVDTITPVSAGEWLADILPNAQRLILPHCGHAPLLTHVETVRAAILEFLNA